MHLSALLQLAFSTDCSIREYRSVVMDSKLHSSPNMLALHWHSTPAYYAFYYAGISDASLSLTHVEESLFHSTK